MNRLIPIVLLIGLFSCKKKEVGPQCPTCHDEVVVNTSEVVISCEGNFGWSNASLSLYDPSEKTVSNSVFSTVNSYSLGDVAQSLQEINGDLYVVVNNTGKIEVLDTATYEVKATINGLTSPRYIAKVAEQKAYVTDLYADQISVIDLTTHQVSGTIPVGGWTEKIEVWEEKAFVYRPDTTMVLVINTGSDLVEDTIFLSTGPSGMVLDKNDFLWVLCNGGNAYTSPALYQIDLSTNSISKSLLFTDLFSSPSGLKINGSKDKMYFLNQGVYAFSIDDTGLPQNPVFSNMGKIFYGLGIDPVNSDIYVADPIDYVQSGVVYRYDSTGTSIDQFSVGIIPQAFWFK